MSQDFGDCPTVSTSRRMSCRIQDTWQSGRGVPSTGSLCFPAPGIAVIPALIVVSYLAITAYSRSAEAEQQHRGWEFWKATTENQCLFLLLLTLAIWSLFSSYGHQQYGVYFIPAIQTIGFTLSHWHNHELYFILLPLTIQSFIFSQWSQNIIWYYYYRYLQYITPSTIHCALHIQYCTFTSVPALEELTI